MTTFDEPPVADGPVFEPVVSFANGAASGHGIVCTECGDSFEHNKPGRRPKKCEKCRTARTPTTRAASGTRIANLEAALTDAGTGLGMALCMFDAFDGQVVMAGSPNLAKALSDVASRDPKVRRSLERVLSSMGWGSVLIAAMAIGAPIMAHHGMLPSSVVENMGRMMAATPNGQAHVNVPAG